MQQRPHAWCKSRRSLWQFLLILWCTYRLVHRPEYATSETYRRLERPADRHSGTSQL